VDQFLGARSLGGLYKDIGRSWNVVALAGFGARDQITTTIGYRF